MRVSLLGTLIQDVRWRHMPKNAFLVLTVGDRHCAPEVCGKAPAALSQSQGQRE